MSHPTRILIFLSLALCLSCASYQKDVGAARGDLQNGRPEDAIKKLEPLAMKEGDDQLVYLFDYATALQAAGRYDDSNKAFFLANKIAEVKDYHSLSRIAGSLVLNEGMVQYKGEDYEKLLINVFLAQNYLMKNNLDDALVETRRLDEILNKYRIEAKRDYEQNSFAVYLSALIWEANKQYDDAYIAYNQVHKLRPDIPMLKSDLIRMSSAARRMDDFQQWKKAFPDVKNDTKWRDSKYGELVLIYQQGRAPVKQPHPSFPRIPKLYPVVTSTHTAKLTVDGIGDFNSEVIYSIQDVAIKTLDDAYAGLIAKRAAGIATKAIVADQVRQKNELLGAITWIGLNLADQADLRQWSTLPETFQIAKTPLPVGTYKVHATGLNTAGAPSGENMSERVVTISPRQKTFLLWRSYN